MSSGKSLNIPREVRLCRVLTDRGTEYCGNPEHHEYELYLALEDIDQDLSYFPLAHG